MSWLPQEKLTIEEKEVIQEYNKRKATLLGKYNTHTKDIDTAHETWIGNFTTQHQEVRPITNVYSLQDETLSENFLDLDDEQTARVVQPKQLEVVVTDEQLTVTFNDEQAHICEQVQTEIHKTK